MRPSPAGAVLGVVLSLVLMLNVALPPTAEATYPGDDGLIVYTEDGSIWTVDPVSLERVQLTDGAGTDWDPRWSPDGSRIVFVRWLTPGGAPNYGLGIVDLDTTAVALVVESGQWLGSPSWSPDGTRIAYIDGSDDTVRILNQDGTVSTVATASDHHFVGNFPPYGPSWSFVRWSPVDPDILLVAEIFGSPSVKGWEIGVLDTSEGKITWIEGLLWGGASGWNADWSPDGRRLLLSIGSVTYTGSEGGVYEAVWSPAGDRIAFACLLPVDSDVFPSTTATTTTTAPTSTTTTAVVERKYLAVADMEGWPTTPDISYLGVPSRELPCTADGIYLTDADGSSLEKLVAMSSLPPTSIAWQPLFNAPVGLVDPATGMWRLRTPAGGVRSFYYGNPGDYPFMGDWDGDGVDTPGLYRRSDGYVYLRNSNTQGNADVSFYFGNPGDIPIPGDFDADGVDTVSIYRPSQQRFYIINQLGSTDTGLGAAEYWFDFGNPGDTPMAGDFDADGWDEVGLYRGSSGFVYYEDQLLPNAGGGTADHQFYFGNPADRFVTADWNHDGTDTVGVYRPATTTFYLRDTNTQGNADHQTSWGEPDWLPVAGTFGFG